MLLKSSLKEIAPCFTLIVLIAYYIYVCYKHNIDTNMTFFNYFYLYKYRPYNMPSVRISYLTQFTSYEMQSYAYNLLIPASYGSSYTGSINVGYFINTVIPNSEHEMRQQETLSYHTNTLQNHENVITYHSYQLQTHDNELNVQQTEIQKHDTEISYQNIRISYVEDINVWGKFPIEN